MTSQFNASRNTQRELLRLASRSMARSAPMLVVVGLFVAYLGWQAERQLAASTFLVVAVLLAAWRLRIALFSEAEAPTLEEKGIDSATRGLEANSLATTCMWAVGTFAIYPHLHGHHEAYYTILVFGSVGVAAFFMPLVGRSFAYLNIGQMGSLIAVSLFSEGAYSVPIAVLAGVYGYGMHTGAKAFGAMAASAIRRGIELEIANAALQEATEAAAAADKAKSVFLANMSHEIRTPLTAVIGFSEELLDVDQTMEQRIDAVRTINLAGKHLLNVINGLLDLSKIDAEQLDLEVAPVPLHALLDEIEVLAHLQATEKGLAFNVEHDYPIPRRVHTDALRLRQILLNLVTNAIKFTASGSVRLHARFLAETSQIEIAVEDTGIGIEPQALERLFKPFGQADSSTSRRFGGTGLGLVISRRLATMMGGTLNVTSRPGAGSSFTLVLPAGDDIELLHTPGAEQLNPARAPVGVGSVKITGSVLLAEDNADNQRLVMRHLNRLGASVEVVENGELAVEAAMAGEFDLVLMDMQMPVMDGLSATRLLRAKGYPGPIVALTANATRQDMAACVDAGCNDFATKPIVRASFDAVVRQFLADRPLDDPLALAAAGIFSGDCAGDANCERARRELGDRIDELLVRSVGAGGAIDFASVKRAARDLRAAAGPANCPPAVRLAGQVEFAATATDHAGLLKLAHRLQDLRRRVQDHLPRAPAPEATQAAVAPHDGNDTRPLVSALLDEDPEMAELVSYFIVKLPDYVQRMRQGVAAMDLERIHRCAHDLKSVGGGYGYPALHEFAKTMEAAVAARDEAAIRVLGKRFEVLAERVQRGAQAMPAATAASRGQLMEAAIS